VERQGVESTRRSVETIRTTPTIIMTLALAAILFLLEFGPRIGGVDVLAIGAVAAIAQSIACRGALPRMRSKIIGLIGALGCLAVYAAAIVLVRGSGELFQPLRFVRAAVNLGGCYALASMYMARERNDIEPLLKAIAWTCSLHAAIMLAQFVSPAFREATYAIVQFEDSQAFRVPGLTGSFGATSIVHTTGLGAAQLLFARGGRQAWVVVPALALNVWALTVLGRTGLVLAIIGSVASWALLPGRQMARGAVGGAVGVMLIAVALQFSGDAAIRYQEVTLEHILEPWRSYENTGRLEAGSVSTLLDGMLFLPDDPTVLIFGSGNSGRGADYIALTRATF
jgi:hypothetical protein